MVNITVVLLACRLIYLWPDQPPDSCWQYCKRLHRPEQSALGSVEWHNGIMAIPAHPHGLQAIALMRNYMNQLIGGLCQAEVQIGVEKYIRINKWTRLAHFVWES